jgi:signal transduction histidine kinase
VAHELEGPLASWRASVELLLEDYGEMTRQELGVMLRTLQRTAVRFQGLVEALVDMGKVEAGKLRVHPAPIPFEKLVRDSLSQIAPALQVKGQKLDVRIGAAPETLVIADRARISQVVINLIRNASKYSPEGEPIIVETHVMDGRAFFQVTDSGTGIDPAEQELIFERYYRSKRVEEEGAGIGLGLALAKAIIQAHGGKIGVSSALGKGSTFWFELAIAQEAINDNERGGTHESAGSGR